MMPQSQSMGSQRWLLLLSGAFLWMLSVQTVVVRCDESISTPLEYEMPLQPFQVRLEYSDSFPMPKSDEMIVLSSTQYFLANQLQDSEPGFLRIVLYQYVRDYVMEESRQHFAKIAMTGTVSFTTPTTEERTDRVQNSLFMKMSADADKYVSILHEEGMEHVVNATLLSIQGNEVTYEDGQMVEMSEPESELPSGEQQQPSEDVESRDMGDDMRNKVLLLCLLVPGLAILVAAIVFVVRIAREINWSRSVFNESQWQRRDMSIQGTTESSAKVGPKATTSQRKLSDIEDLSDISSETGRLDA